MSRQGALVFKQLEHTAKTAAQSGAETVFSKLTVIHDRPCKDQPDAFLFQAFVGVETATLRIDVTVCFGSRVRIRRMTKLPFVAAQG